MERSRESQEPRPLPFSLDGDSLALDLANTVRHRWRAEQRVDRLANYDDLVRFGLTAGVLDTAQAAALQAEAKARPRAAAAALARARQVREALHDVFLALAGGRTPSPEVLHALERELPGAYASPRLRPSQGKVQLEWCCAVNLDAVSAAALRSAVELLESEQELSRLRSCESETCRWLFLDATKNHSRRWCDMKTCGNRAKARRHYERTHGEPDD